MYILPHFLGTSLLVQSVAHQTCNEIPGLDEALTWPQRLVMKTFYGLPLIQSGVGERGGSVVECRTPEREVRGSRPTAAVLCPWARHFTPRKYWLITQEAMAPSRHDWKIVDWDVKPQHNQQIKVASDFSYWRKCAFMITGLDFTSFEDCLFK